MTEREIFEALKEIPENADYVDFFDKKITAIDRKAEKAKEYKAKKNVAAEQDKAAILEAITTTPQTVNDIVEAVKDKIKDVTTNKVVPKLTLLIKEGKIEKSTIRVDGRAKKVYALPGSFDVDEKEE